MEAIAYCTTFLPEHIPSYEDTERSFSFLNKKTVSTNSATSRDKKEKSENYQEISQGIDIAFKARPLLLSNACPPLYKGRDVNTQGVRWPPSSSLVRTLKGVAASLHRVGCIVLF